MTVFCNYDYENFPFSMKKMGYFSIKKQNWIKLFILFYRKWKYLQNEKDSNILLFFRIGAIYKILTGTTQKIWQPVSEPFLAAHCKGPDNLKYFIESLPPKVHHHISLVELPRFGHKLIFLSIFLLVLQAEKFFQ